MSAHVAPPHVRKFYPRAIKAIWFIRSFIWYVKASFKVSEEQIALLLSVCSDDLNNVELPKTKMIGPFTLGGLDGFPFVGKTGLGAFSHHIPQHGVALLFFGPHVGITNKAEVGVVVRPGQAKPSACCGAAQAALKELEAGTITPKTVAQYDIDDFQQESIRQFVLAHKQPILSAGPQGDPKRFLELTEVMYRQTRDSMLKLFSAVPFEKPTFAFGGILINEDNSAPSDIDFRNVYRIDGRGVTDITGDYLDQTAERFQALDRGNSEAFN